MAQSSGYAKYADLLGEVSPEEEARQAAARQAAASTPEAKFAQTLAANRQSNANATMGIGPRAAAREANISSGRITGAAPNLFGLSLAPASAPQAAALQDQAVAARKERDGGFAGDLGRLAVGGAKVLVNPINSVIGDYLPEPAQAAIGGPGYISGALLDEGADQLIPGGSGSRGANIIPGVAGTGGDRFYPSETIQSGSYNDGYRGVGNPRVPVAGDGSGGAGGAGGAAAGAGGAQGRGDYRTDALDPDIRSMLDAERAGGPSEAEALLQKATDRVAARSLGIAAGARGGAGARERARTQAVGANASLGAQAAADLAALRARENAESRQRQANIMQLLQNNAAAGDTRDLGYEQTASGERQARYNVDATNARFNAQQPVGLTDDPLAWLFEAATGRPLRTRGV